MRELYRKNLIQLPRLTALEREEARLDGERGQLVASAAQAKGKVTETALQIMQIDQDLRSEVAKELREIQGRISELSERKIAAEDQLRRVDIRAPQAGTVHQLAVHTVGGIVGPGELMMLIVPEGDHLAIEVKIPTQEIDQVRVGQRPPCASPPSTSARRRRSRASFPSSLRTSRRTAAPARATIPRA